MKFVFPQNYDFNMKFLGFLDYSTIILNLLWFLFILFIVNLFPLALDIKILILIIFEFPLLIFSIVGFNGENIVYMIFYILKYLTKPKVFLYTKKKP